MKFLQLIEKLSETYTIQFETRKDWGRIKNGKVELEIGKTTESVHNYLLGWELESPTLFDDGSAMCIDYLEEDESIIALFRVEDISESDKSSIFNFFSK